MRDRKLAAVALVIVAIIIGLLAWAVVDQRFTNRALIRANHALIQAFEKQSDERRAALAKLLDRYDAKAEHHRRQTKADLRKVIRSLREVLRQLGGDPSALPPRGHSSGSRSTTPNPDDDDGRPGQPRPSPSPEPSPTCLPIFEICI